MANRQEIESLIADFETQKDLPPGAVRDMRAAIETSPYLQEIMSNAIGDKSLRHIRISNDANEAGHYDRATGTVNVNASIFKNFTGSDRVDVLTATLGHETGHALMKRSADFTVTKFDYGLDQLIKDGANNGEPSVNITALAQEVKQDFRKNEGFAELVSMNSLASRVEFTTGHFDRAEFMRRAEPSTSCIENGKLLEGIKIDAHGLQITGGKIEGAPIEKVAVCHFDKGPATLGLKGTSSYDDNYAAYTVSTAVSLWKDRAGASTQPTPLIELDLAALKSSKEGVENAGLELGGQGKGFDVFDVSNGQRTMVGLRQLGNSGAKQPDDAPEIDSPKQNVLADNPEHPDFDTFNRIHEWALGTGQWDKEKSRNVAGALYKEQMADPMLQRVDKVGGGLGRDGAENAFAVYAPFGDKGPFLYAEVDGREASQQPAQQNLEQAEQIKQQQVQQQQLEQQQQRDNPVPRGPPM